MKKELKNKMEQFLKDVPNARERKKKDKAIGAITQRMYSALTDISLDKLDEIVTTVLALDRYWRLILREKPELRGTDYDDKENLEAKAKQDLGYTVLPMPPPSKRQSIEDDIAWFNRMP